MAGQLAQAGPVGGQVSQGSAAIVQSGSMTTVTQSSPRLSLNWQSFNTSASETVQFIQPSASSVAVNRIFDSSPTQFFGQLNANGQVYLINPNGVLFGAGSQVNVGGLVASTLDISDTAAGTATRRFFGSGTGSVTNLGSIDTGNGGYVAFIGHTVSNQGSIHAPSGTVALGAGNDVTLSFADNSLVKLQVNQGTLNDLAENRGLIRADGGAVFLSAGAKDAVLASVVNNTGIIEARSVRNVNGTIVLGGGAQSSVTNSGTLDASGRQASETGGTVKVLGDTVQLAPGSKIDVSGDAGGGTALVGGNFLGAGPEQNASTTIVSAGSTINADALTQGNGGQVAVWSDVSTEFNGSITARGGQSGGNGGSVETSGKHLKIGTDAFVSTLGPMGKAGDWLLDPQDFTIAPTGGDITDAQITQALQNTDVTIKTGSGTSCVGISCGSGISGAGDIFVTGGASVGGSDWTSGTTLTLSAYRNVDIRDSSFIDASSGSGHIVLRADNTGTNVGTVKVDSNSGFLTSDQGSIKIYYNPTSYFSPTDYSQWLYYGSLNSYMLVNIVPRVANKTYDGTTNAEIISYTLHSLPPGIAVIVSDATANFNSKSVGANKSVTVSGILMYGDNVDAYALNGLDSVTATISKADLSLSGISANNKTYNGTTAATISGTAAVTPFIGDVVSVSGTGAGSTFNSKNVGTGLSVTVAGYTLSGADAGNYNLVLPTNLTANITKANLAVSGITANNKTYDGSTAATLSGTATVSAFGSDVVAVSGTGSASFSDKNSGGNKAVTVTGYSLSGADAGNYNIVQPSGLTATISKADLAVSGLAVSNKTYDGTTAATLSGTPAVTPIGSDVISVTGTVTASFANKNAGSNKAVTVTGYWLTGADAGNYNLVQPTGLTGTINKANLAVSGITAADKTYDGTTGAILTGTASVTTIGGDVVSVTGTGIGSFATKNAGANKAITVTGYSLTGADAGNYNVVQPTGLSATINRADLSLSGITANNKTYDGTTAATISGTATVAAIGSDVVSISGSGTGSTFDTKDVGTGKAVTVAGYTLSGADAGNYNLVLPTNLTANITKANLAVSGITANNKTYDGSTAATLSGTATVSAFGSDVVAVTGTGSATFSDKNAGSNKAITVTGYSLAGADAGNYNVVQPTGLTASISKADLAVSGVSAADKTYDGTTAATLSGTATATPIGSDVVSVTGSGTASFANKNAGSNKAVTVTGYSLTGADAGNYNIVQPSGLTATISPASITVSGITVSDKRFDRSTRATVDTSGVILSGKVDADAVSVSATGSFADAAIGNGKTVNLRSTYGGADVNNYVFTDQETATGNILGVASVRQPLRDAVAQVLSPVLPGQASAGPGSPFSRSSGSTAETGGRAPADSPSAGAGEKAVPRAGLLPTVTGALATILDIQGYGIQLPAMTTSISE